MALQIPEEQIPVIKKLVGLGPAELDKLLQGLREAEPSLYVGELIPKVAAKSQMPPDDVQAILSVLASLYVTRDRQGYGMEPFLEEIRSSLQLSDIPIDDAVSWPRLRTFFDNALRLEDSLGVSAKALFVMLQHERVYGSARIFTDIRPVFKTDIAEAPGAAVLIHMLRIGYHEDNAHRELYFAMDGDDLRQLLDTVHRALRKEETLEAMMTKSGVRILRRDGSE
jgi:hypothetical protein